MAILSFIAPEIPAESKDKFLGAWSTLMTDLKAQPGVAGADGGVVVAQDGAPVTEFKFVQWIAFKSAKEAEDFASSAWSKEHQARYQAKAGGDPAVGNFEVPEFPVGKTPTPFLQFSTLLLDDGKQDEARQVWTDLVKSLGKDTFGGRSVSGPSVGVGLIGWESLEQAGEAFKKPETAALWAKYQTLGKGKNLIVKLQ